MTILGRNNGNGQSSSTKVGKHLYIMVVDREEMVLMLKHVLKTGCEEHLTMDGSLEAASIAENATRLLHMLPRMREAGTNSVSPLSHRETEILTQVARGQSNKRIADTFCLSKHTVKNHIYSIRRKLDAKDRAHAVVLAMLNGWLNIDDVSEVQSEPEQASSLVES
jgi:DNA-binding CsgD family transcriptional regulator